MSWKDKKILVIVESPNKCKHILEYLKAAGYSKVSVIASVGHISGLKDNKSSYKNTGVFPNDNFKMDIAIDDDKKDVVNRLKEQVSSAEHVFLMTDGDREGEAIAWSLIKFLKLKSGTYSRAITHEITPKAVVNAIENPVKLDEDLVCAAHSRMAIDKMVGYSLSPIAKAYVGAKSVGRCQSAGLKLVVDREKEIQDFKPETYYDLYLNFKKNNVEFKAKYVGTDKNPIQHLKFEADVKVVKYNCSGKYIVKDIVKKEKQESPKPPFCTATFQQEVAGKLGIKVKDAMSIAQKLFESGKITYHRTDDVSFSVEFIDIIKPYIINMYGKYVEPRKGKTQGNEQNGHECLRVTDPSLTPEKYNNIDKNIFNNKVYTLIWQRTIAACLPNAIISETTYNIYNNDQKFNLISNEIIDEGYRAVYNYNDSQDEPAVKETFIINEVLNDCKLEDVKKSTTPPSRYTEASLVKTLQDKGIGRPSTFATIVDTVLSPTRGYAEVQEKKIVPTDRGIQLSNFLDRSFSNIINLNYTKDLEENLDKIAKGEDNKLNFLNIFYNNLENTIKNNTELPQDAKEEKICPKCGAKMTIRRSRFGKLFYGCTQYPKCNGILNIE